jgi:hypothetical protein
MTLRKLLLGTAIALAMISPALAEMPKPDPLGAINDFIIVNVTMTENLCGADAVGPLLKAAQLEIKRTGRTDQRGQDDWRTIETRNIDQQGLASWCSGQKSSNKIFEASLAKDPKYLIRTGKPDGGVYE